MTPTVAGEIAEAAAAAPPLAVCHRPGCVVTEKSRPCSDNYIDTKNSHIDPVPATAASRSAPAPPTAAACASAGSIRCGSGATPPAAPDLRCCSAQPLASPLATTRRRTRRRRACRRGPRQRAGVAGSASAAAGASWCTTQRSPPPPHAISARAPANRRRGGGGGSSAGAHVRRGRVSRAAGQIWRGATARPYACDRARVAAAAAQDRSGGARGSAAPARGASRRARWRAAQRRRRLVGRRALPRARTAGGIRHAKRPRHRLVNRTVGAQQPSACGTLGTPRRRSRVAPGGRARRRRGEQRRQRDSTDGSSAEWAGTRQQGVARAAPRATTGRAARRARGWRRRGARRGRRRRRPRAAPPAAWRR